MQLKKSKKAVAGLEIFVSIVTMLFMIGLVVAVFVIAGVKIESATRITSSSGSVYQPSYTLTSAGSNLTACGDSPDSVITSITSVENSSIAGAINSGNYTFSACKLYSINGVVGTMYNNTAVNVTYEYAYTSSAVGQNTIGKTTLAIADAPNWFGIFIVMGALVVLVLMVVMIIGAIKKSGVAGGGSEGG